MTGKPLWVLLGLGLLLLTYAFFRWQDDLKIQHAADLAAQAQVATAQIDRVQGLATSLATQNAQAEQALDSLKAHDEALGRALARVKIPPRPAGSVPDTCKTYDDRAGALEVALGIAGAQLDTAHARIDTLTSLRRQDASLMADQRLALETAKHALLPYQKVVLPTPTHKLLGLIQMPSLVVGVAAVYAGGKMYAGPGATFGFRIAL